MKKNILFIESGQYGGGSFNALHYILKFLDREKYDPFVIYFNKSKYYQKTLDLNIKTFLLNDIVYSLKSNKLVFKFLNYINLFLSQKIPSTSILFEKLIHYQTINYINKIIKKHNIHLIHCNVQIARDLFITFCSLKNKIPIVNFIRSPKIDIMNDYKSNFVNQNNNKIIAVSKSIKELWKNEGIENSKFEVIYDGIDTTVLKKINFYNELNLKKNNDYYFIGCVGRFVKGKGQMILINAFEKLINNNTKKFKLILLGEGPNMNSLQKYVNDNGLSNDIFFLGYKDNAIDYINSFDLLVLPSSIDVCSNVLLESLYCKTLTIALAKGGNAEIIFDNFNGYLFYENNPDELKNIINKMILNKGSHDYFKKNGFKLINDNFLIKKNIKLIESIYDQYLLG